MNDIHPIKPLIETPIFTQIQIILIWIVVIAISAIVIYILFQKYKKYFVKEKEVLPPPQPPIDYQAIANKKLKKLESQKSSITADEFHLQITQIIKEYLQGILKTSFVEMTTTEISNKKFTVLPQKEITISFLKQVDQTKFAKQELQKTIDEKIISTARSIINDF